VAQDPPIPLIYVIDDDDAVRDSLDAYLSLMGMKVVAYSSARQLLDGEVDAPHVLIIDINMPDMDGFALLDGLRDRGVDAPAIFMTGLGEPDVRARALKAGAHRFFDKPVDPKVLLATVKRLLSDNAE
jgi:two-component system, LuxR family, response regulator FixJ